MNLRLPNAHPSLRTVYSACHEVLYSSEVFSGRFIPIRFLKNACSAEAQRNAFGDLYTELQRWALLFEIKFAVVSQHEIGW